MDLEIKFTQSRDLGVREAGFLRQGKFFRCSHFTFSK